jgi:peptidyl-tRNA hydrolase, PTH1 family
VSRTSHRLTSLIARFRKAGETVADQPDPVWLVVGLGNPGPGYAGNRHNVGYLVVEELASRLGSSFRTHKSRQSEVVEGRLSIGGPRVVLARPRSYMNETGGPTSALVKFYKVPLDHLVVIHDELDIPFDTMRIKLGGGDNGHNGLRSVRASLGSGDFHRVRVGVGRPPGRQDPAAFVLSDYSAKERKVLPLQVDRAADAVEALITEGLERTQARFNS